MVGAVGSLDQLKEQEIVGNKIHRWIDEYI